MAGIRIVRTTESGLTGKKSAMHIMCVRTGSFTIIPQRLINQSFFYIFGADRVQKISKKIDFSLWMSDRVAEIGFSFWRT